MTTHDTPKAITPVGDEDAYPSEDLKVLKRVELRSISLKDLLTKYPERKKRRWGRPI